MRPEMKSGQNEIPTRHKRSFVYALLSIVSKMK